MPETSPRSLHWAVRSALLGGAGVLAGGFAAVLFLWLVGRLSLIRAIVSLADPGQPFVRLLAGLVMAFVVVALAGAIQGLVAGLVLHRVAPIRPRRFLLWRSVVAFAVALTAVIIPFLLLTGLVAFYANAEAGRVSDFVTLFALYGGLYGAILGFFFGWLTVGIRAMWRVLLTAIAGYAVGGALLGLILRWNAALVDQGRPLNTFLFLALVVLAINLPGMALGWIYGWFGRREADKKPLAALPGPFWRYVGLVGLGILAIGVVSFIFQLAQFATIRPASLSQQLRLPTVGVRWQPKQAVVQSTGELTAPAAVASATTLALAWAENGDVFLSTQTAQGTWTQPISVPSNTAAVSSLQLVADSSGAWHLVWQATGSGDGSEIFYSRCAADECDAPTRLSDLSDLGCVASNEGKYTAQAVAIDAADTLMVAWNASGTITYAVWPAATAPPDSATGCVTGANEPELDLTASRPGQFTLAFTDEANREVKMMRFSDGAWDSEATVVGTGRAPTVLATADGLHSAWCNTDDQVLYRSPAGVNETLASPACLGRPTLASDAKGRLHLLWYSNTVANNADVDRPGSFLYESIRHQGGWTEPALVAATTAAVQPTLVTDAASNLYAAWTDGATLFTALQPAYDCNGATINETVQTVLGVVENGRHWSDDQPSPFCGNHYDRLLFTPNPPPGAEAPSTPNAAFDLVHEVIKQARYEVLLTNMEWVEDQNEDSPGFLYAQTIAQLYRQLKADPDQYPRGLTVRVLLGNYPEVAGLEWGDQIWNVLEDLRAVGVEEMVNPEIGWKLEVANFEGDLPHSHAKFYVIDGATLIAAGFNYSYLHYPADHPSGLGLNLVDYAIEVTGPVAQAGLAAYDDLWIGAEQVHCDDFYPPIERLWTWRCTQRVAEGGHVPEVLRFAQSDGDDAAFSLLRNDTHEEADEAVAAAVAAADESLDIFEVNFTMAFICDVAIIFEGVCDYSYAMPYMEAIMTALETNRVPVRILVERAAMNGLENRVAIRIFQNELQRRGLLDLVEIRLYEGKMHGKALSIDDELLIVGSQNFHYSAWGEGLVEYNVATDAPEAIETFQRAFAYHWERGDPIDLSE